jgi:hypothetical protein
VLPVTKGGLVVGGEWTEDTGHESARLLGVGGAEGGDGYIPVAGECGGVRLGQSCHAARVGGFDVAAAKPVKAGGRLAQRDAHTGGQNRAR